MPANKDRKRLVRSRMQKTGESYTTALRHVRSKGHSAPPRTTVPPTIDHAALAGMRDEVVAQKTGRTWLQWCELLDAEGAADKMHRDIARALRERHGVSAWWAQTVTGGYERIKGRRAKNERPGGFGVGKSRTFAVPIARLLRAFAPKARTGWLGDEAVTARRSKHREVVRWRSSDGAFVDVYLVAKGPAKTTVNVQLSRLPAAAEVARQRTLWTRRLQALGEWLAADAGA